MLGARATSGAVLVAIGMLAAAAAPARADTRQDVVLAFTSAQPGTATGSRFEARWRNPHDPAGKPYAMRQIVSHLPPGFVYDTSAIDRCHASDWELFVRGASACPEGSLVSRGTLVTDNGEPSPVPRHMTLSLTMFNTEGGFVSLAEALDPPFERALRVVARNEIRGSTVTTRFPTFPSLSEPDRAMAFSHMRVSGQARVRGGRAYARLPSTCPRVGYWTTTMDFLYQDDRRQSVEARSPCRRAGGSPGAGIAISGVPRSSCVSRPFTVRVRIATNAGVERVVVLLDGRRLVSTRRRSFSQRIRPAELGAGKHTLAVHARPLARRSVTFRTCRSGRTR